MIFFSPLVLFSLKKPSKLLQNQGILCFSICIPCRVRNQPTSSRLIWCSWNARGWAGRPGVQSPLGCMGKAVCLLWLQMGRQDQIFMRCHCSNALGFCEARSTGESGRHLLGGPIKAGQWSNHLVAQARTRTVITATSEPQTRCQNLS